MKRICKCIKSIIIEKIVYFEEGKIYKFQDVYMNENCRVHKPRRRVYHPGTEKSKVIWANFKATNVRPLAWEDKPHPPIIFGGFDEFFTVDIVYERKLKLQKLNKI